jgi:hypothetical protein
LRAVVIGNARYNPKIEFKTMHQIGQRSNWAAGLVSGQEPIAENEYFFSSVHRAVLPNAPILPEAKCATR